MEPEFWFESWKAEGSATSFHRPDIHPFVQKHLNPEMLKGKRVLVPLCGKTNDMMWFREHADHVIGIELVDKAILQFFEEQNLPYNNSRKDFFEAERLSIIHKDLFELTAEDLGMVDLIYDRASLIAFPEKMRVDYINKLDQLSHVGTQTLLITLEYAPILPTPPFSLNEADIKGYYGSNHTIEHVEAVNRPDHRMKQKLGLEYFIENAYLMTKLEDLPDKNQ